MTEHDHQVALFEWASLNSANMPELEVMYAIPNGGARSKATAGKLKAEGVKAGIPDICLPLQTEEYGALYIELKMPLSHGKRAGRVSEAQLGMCKMLNERGNLAVIAFGWEDAAKWISAHVLDHRMRRNLLESEDLA